LLADADVFVENIKPGSLDKLVAASDEILQMRQERLSGQ
jgi:crotonobetainyl-CoA:carnitine CoA-transferase CaiB-like acyl-CoA transferase